MWYVVCVHVHGAVADSTFGMCVCVCLVQVVHFQRTQRLRDEQQQVTPLLPPPPLPPPATSCHRLSPLSLPIPFQAHFPLPSSFVCRRG